MRRDQGIIRDGSNNPSRPTGSGSAGRKVRPMNQGRSAYITTRCYSADGEQIWDGDFGSTVYAIAVGSNGWVYHSGDSPYASAMRFGGKIIWTSSTFTANAFSYGIAATDDHVYYGVDSTTALQFIAKLDASTGDDLLHIGEVSPPTVSRKGRIRCDSSGNMYAISLSGDSVVKYVSDSAFWTASPSNVTGFDPSGLDVTSAGDVFVSRTDAVIGGGGTTTIKAEYRFDSSVNNISPPTSPTLISFTEESTSTELFLGYKNIGCSPDGTQWVAYNIITQNITGTHSATIGSNLGGSVFRPYTAMAVNDSGIFTYSIERGSTSPIATHEIRASDNSLIARLDHGAAIYDAIVLPNGSVIVAGGRVLRADFP